MADPPAKNRSIDGGRSPKGSRLFDWLILPLISLCSRRNDKVVEQVVSQSIDKQPGGCETSDSSGDYAPTYFESINMHEWNDKDEITNRSESVLQSIAEEVPEPDRLKLLPLSNESSSSEPNEVKLNDLPLLPLLVICGFLRTNNCCRDLNSFRKTCRSFAFAVNTFLEYRPNLPVISILRQFFESHIACPEIRGGFNRHNYFIHPLLFAGQFGKNMFKTSTRNWYKKLVKPKKKNDTSFEIPIYTSWRNSIDINSTQMLKIQEVLCGPVDKLDLTFYEDDNNDIAIARAFLKNIVSWNKLTLCVHAFNSVVISFILELLRKRPNWANGKVEIDTMHFREDTDSDLFLTVLDSTTNHVKLREDDAYELFFGFPTGFWYQWLLQKIREGYKVRFNRSSRPLSESPDNLEPLTSDDYNLYEIEWCKL